MSQARFNEREKRQSADAHETASADGGAKAADPRGGAAGASKKKKGRGFVGLAVMAALVVGVMWWKTSGRDDANAQVYTQALEIVENAPGYEDRPDVYKGLVRSAHAAAFAETYSMGGRRTGASFDEERYLALLFEDMIREAKQNGDDDAASDLEALRLVMRLPADD